VRQGAGRAWAVTNGPGRLRGIVQLFAPMGDLCGRHQLRMAEVVNSVGRVLTAYSNAAPGPVERIGLDVLRSGNPPSLIAKLEASRRQTPVPAYGVGSLSSGRCAPWGWPVASRN
jgi:hypothetical protein